MLNFLIFIFIHMFHFEYYFSFICFILNIFFILLFYFWIHFLLICFNLSILFFPMFQFEYFFHSYVSFWSITYAWTVSHMCQFELLKNLSFYYNSYISFSIFTRFQLLFNVPSYIFWYELWEVTSINIIILNPHFHTVNFFIFYFPQLN